MHVVCACRRLGLPAACMIRSCVRMCFSCLSLPDRIHRSSAAYVRTMRICCTHRYRSTSLYPSSLFTYVRFRPPFAPQGKKIEDCNIMHTIGIWNIKSYGLSELSSYIYTPISYQTTLSSHLFLFLFFFSSRSQASQLDPVRQLDECKHTECRNQ